MINYIEIFGYYIFICQLVLLVPAIKKFTILHKIIILLVIAILTMIPKIYLSVNILYILRGVFGELSILFIILMLIFFIVNLFNLSFIKVKHRLINIYSMLLVSIFGIILYLSALGFINIDIYYYGFNYSFMQMICFVFVLLYLMYFCDLYFLLMIIAFIMYFFKVQISMNFIDYLIDPMLWIYSMIYLFKRFILNVKE